MCVFSLKDKLLYFLLSVFLMLPAVSDAHHRHALVIGLGQQEDRSWAKINGDKDVLLVRQMLETAGYADVKTLINQDATKHNIMQAFESLVRRSREGDTVYIHFSGHGQQISDVDSDENDDWDECWIPYDAYARCCDRDDGSRHLTDDEINSELARIKGRIGTKGRLLVVVDACHSGDSSRGEDDVVRGTRDKFFAGRNYALNVKHSSRRDWIILSACRDYQRNAELKTSGKRLYHSLAVTGEHVSLVDTQFVKSCDSFACIRTGLVAQGNFTCVFSVYGTEDEGIRRILFFAVVETDMVCM